MELKNSRYNTEIGSIILDNYNSIYLLDIKNELMEPYFFNSDVAKAMIDVVGEGVPYETAFNDFRDRFVLQEERKLFTEKTKVKNVVKELEKSGQFYYVFRRRNTQGIPEYVEMYVTYMGNSSYAIVCFRTVSEDVNQIKMDILNYDTPEEDLCGTLGKRTVLIIEDDLINVSKLTIEIEK